MNFIKDHYCDYCLPGIIFSVPWILDYHMVLPIGSW